MFRLLALLLLLLCSARSPGASGDERCRIPAGVYRPFYADPAELGLAIEAFQLDRTPVTHGDFLVFVTAQPGWRRSQVKRVFADTDYLRDWADDLDPGAGKRDLPVVNVSWFAARAYARWRGARLPTMDEWEYAAAADETHADARSDPAFRQRLLESFAQIGKAEPHRAGSVMTNLYGVTDLHGNVWEWVEDFNSLLVTGESRADASVERGLYCAAGSLSGLNPSDYPAYMRYAFRSSLKARYTVSNLGFRVAYGRTQK